MSVPTAVTGWIPNSRIRRGVIRDPPPIPVMPMSSPIPNPKMTIIGSMNRDSVAPSGPFQPFGLFQSSWSRDGARQGSNRLFPPLRVGNDLTSALHPGVRVLDQAPDGLRQPVLADIRQGDLLEDGAQIRAHRDPDVAQALGRAGVLGVLGSPILDVRERALDSADHVGDGDVVRRTREPVSAAGPALGPDQPGVLQLEEDVLQELKWDVL